MLYNVLSVLIEAFLMRVAHPYAPMHNSHNSPCPSPLILKVMEVVLRQGFVHPISFVPTLVALEVDPCEGNAKLAHRMMMIMRDK